MDRKKTKRKEKKKSCFYASKRHGRKLKKNETDNLYRVKGDRKIEE
jgi:hypothetical protein